jgi:4-oxalocrotonate tautomerase
LQRAGAAERTRPVTAPAHGGAARSGNQPTKEDGMPFVNVKVIEGVFSNDQKAEIVTRLSETMIDIEGEAMRPVTWVVLEEVASGDWGIGGKTLTTQDVKDLPASGR